jgi:hypothetical protein
MSSFDGTTKSEHAEADPLERLVEAFVDQSVPVGPDAAVNRRLIEAMNAASRRDAVTPTQPVDVDNPWHSVGERPSRRRRLVRVFVQQAFSLAAAVAIVAGAAVLWRTPREIGQSAALPPAEALDSAAAVEANSTELARIFDAALDAYLKMPRHQRADRQALEEVFAAVLRENPEFARSKSWRRAQQRLTVALEQPEVLTMGVSLLGTLSWTTYGRF